jgi:Rieske Fe-S protein
MTTARDTGTNPADGEVSRRQWVRDVAIAGAVVATGAGLAACSTSTPNAGTAPSTAPGTGPTAGAAPSGAAGSAPTVTHGKVPSVGHTAPPETPDTQTPSFVVAKTSSIPVGGGVVYPSHGVVITQPKSGTFKVFNSSCTHLGCMVNKVAAGLILCPCHGAKFSIVDGSVKAGPALRPLPAQDFSIDNGEVVLD